MRQHALGSAYHLIVAVKGGKSLWSHTLDTFCHSFCLVTEFSRLPCRLQLVNLLPHCTTILFLQYGITNWYLTWESHWWATLILSAYEITHKRDFWMKIYIWLITVIFYIIAAFLFIAPFINRYSNMLGARGGAVGWGTALQTRRSRVWFLMASLEFFIDTILPVALWPWGWLSL